MELEKAEEKQQDFIPPDAWPLFLENLQGFVYCYDESGLITYANPVCAEVLGCSPEHLKGKTLLDFIPPVHRIQEGDALMELHRSTTQVSRRVVLTDASQHEKQYRLNLLPVIKDSVLTGGIAILEPIREADQIEQALLRSEALYRELFETSLDGIAVVDPNGIFLDCNPAFAELLGFDSRESVLN